MRKGSSTDSEIKHGSSTDDSMHTLAGVCPISDRYNSAVRVAHPNTSPSADTSDDGGRRTDRDVRASKRVLAAERSVVGSDRAVGSATEDAPDHGLHAAVRGVFLTP